MKILVTGANGNVARGVVPRLVEAGHEVVLCDLVPPKEDTGLPFHQLDVQTGFGLEKAIAGCDLLLHTPAWHGIHWREKSEIDFWRLNVDGTFWALQAARAEGVRRLVFLSSQAWHGHYDKYGFTKRIGEELCEYHRRAHGLRYVAIRPADLTPWGDDWVNRYGARLLYGGVDREDVLDAVLVSVARLERERPEGEEAEGREAEGIVLDAVRPDAFDEGQLEGWEGDPYGAVERIFPGSRDLLTKYALRIDRKPGISRATLGWEETGYAPKRHFGTFLEELRRLDAAGGEDAVRSMRCPY